MASSGTETVPMACATATLLHAAAAAAAAVDEKAGDSTLHDAATLAVSLSGGVGGESTPARTGSTPQVTPQPASELAVSNNKKAGDFSRLVSATSAEKGGGGSKAKGKKGGGSGNRRKGGSGKGQTVTFQKPDGEGTDSASKSGTASINLEPRVTPASDFGGAAPSTAGGETTQMVQVTAASAAAPPSDFLTAQISPVRSSARRAAREAKKRKEEEDERRRRQVEELAAATTSSSSAAAARRNASPPPSEGKGSQNRPPGAGNSKLTSPKTFLTPRAPASVVQMKNNGGQADGAGRPGLATGLTPTNFASDFGKVSQDTRLTEYEESNGEFYFSARINFRPIGHPAKFLSFCSNRRRRFTCFFARLP